MSERWVVTPLDDVPGYADEGRPRWHMIRSSLGIGAFGINAWTSTAPGQVVIGEHDELGQGAGAHEELYLVVSGTARFVLEGETVVAPAGTIVFVRDPAVKRSATADPGTTVMVVGGRPGAAFTVSPWERSAEALRFWTTGEWDRAIDVLERQRRDTPADAGVLYNLACAESRGGRVDDAIGHLLESIEIEPRFAENARGDADFDPIRDDARFPRD